MESTLFRIAVLAVTPPLALWLLRRRIPRVPWIRVQTAKLSAEEHLAFMGLAVLGVILIVPFWYVVLRYTLPIPEPPPGVWTQSPSTAPWVFASLILAGLTAEIPMGVLRPALLYDDRIRLEGSSVGWVEKISLVAIVGVPLALYLGATSDSYVVWGEDGIEDNPFSTLGERQAHPFEELRGIELGVEREPEPTWEFILTFEGEVVYSTGHITATMCRSVGALLDQEAHELLLEARAGKPALCQ